MISDERGQQLHDRATRGKSLSESERAQLEAWYAAHDHAEMEALGLTAEGETNAELKHQIDIALAQVTRITKRIQETKAENEMLRREISLLSQRLQESTTPHPA